MVWEDITEACRRSASLLDDVRPMVSTPEFSLLDSMSAVELMDAKMDQCFQLQGSMRAEVLLNPALPAVMTLDTVTKILHILVSYEAAFYDGASVLESTHGCIYLWDGAWRYLEQRSAETKVASERAAVQTLLAYCRCLHASLWATSHAVLEADIYEDEDFQPQVSPWVSEASASYEEVHVEIATALLALQALPQQDSCTASLQKLLRTRLALHDLLRSIDGYACSALRYGSTVRKLMVQSADSYANMQAQAEAGGDAEGSRATLLKAKLAREKQRLPAVQEQYSTYQTALSAAAAELKALGETAGIGVLEGGEEDPGEEGVVAALASPQVTFAFSSTLVRTQQSSPIRRVVLRSLVASTKYLRDIVQELIALDDISRDLAARTARGPDALTYDHLLSVTMNASDERYHLISRSLWLSYLNELTCEHMKSIIRASMRAWGVPAILVDGDLVLHNWIPETLCKVFFDSLKCFCICRNKLLVKTDLLLQGWAAVMQEAEQIDLQFRQEIGVGTGASRQVWCTHWCLTLLGQIMDMQFCLLIESHLLSTSELDYFFWYWDHLCGVRLTAQDNLLSMRYELQQREYEDLLNEHRLKVAKTKQQGGKAAPPALPTPPTPPTGSPEGPPSAAVYSLRGRKELCRGLLRVTAALAKKGSCVHASNVIKTKNKYTAWSWRFLQRFRSFQHLTQPPMLTYEGFVRVVGEDSPTGEQEGAPQLVHDILEGAAACFKDAKLFYDAARKVPGAEQVTPADSCAAHLAPTLLKVAITSSVQCMQLLMAVKQQLKQAPEAHGVHRKRLVADTKLNPHFPVIKLE